ncbi:MAG: 4Fe-4S dicluster domain-containing protein [Desulfitobacteriaceae bacterium]|nr:4Fe-4S dicluster domain-containing protein [Desulfitobacteriaceae bacterium]
MSKYTIVIDLNKCYGCAGCQVACKEWNTSGPYGPLPDINPWGKDQWSMFWLKVLHYESGKYPNVQETSMPIGCMHCDEPACVKVCPVGATYKRPDGIVLVDYDDCIGCKYCINACPYGARVFDPVQGITKKCTMCVDRITSEILPEEDRIPACVRSCPVHARTFGDLDDPQSEVSYLIANNSSFALNPEYGTKPVVRYLPFRGIDTVRRHK